jgi:hypothetical protein
MIIHESIVNPSQSSTVYIQLVATGIPPFIIIEGKEVASLSLKEFCPIIFAQF